MKEQLEKLYDQVKELERQALVEAIMKFGDKEVCESGEFWSFEWEKYSICPTVTIAGKTLLCDDGDYDYFPSYGGKIFEICIRLDSSEKDVLDIELDILSVYPDENFCYFESVIERTDDIIDRTCKETQAAIEDICECENFDNICMGQVKYIIECMEREFERRNT